MSEGPGRRIAVVGSGLAGLAAAWLLGRRHRVTVFEAAARPGMGAHSLRPHGGAQGPVIDVPLRVFTPGYYPTLLALFEHVGIRVAPVDYAASFSYFGGETYFRYRNVRVGRRSIAYPPPAMLLRGEMRRIGRDLIRFHRRAPMHLAAGSLRGRTLGDYLSAEAYSPEFVDGFVLPAYAAICTCCTESARRYPADVIVDYMCSGVATRGVMRAVDGTPEVTARLLARARDVYLSTPVEAIRPEGDAVQVTAGGDTRAFDQVILATRADQAAALVAHDGELADALARVPHEWSRVVVHRDPALAPRRRRDWSPVNFVVDPARDAPMATIWLNRVQDGLGADPVFQTWNPLRDPAPATVMAEARFARPVVTVGTRDVPDRLARLNADPHRRIRVVGSYVEPGVPLLEAAAASAVRVARLLSEPALFAPPVGAMDG